MQYTHNYYYFFLNDLFWPSVHDRPLYQLGAWIIIEPMLLKPQCLTLHGTSETFRSCPEFTIPYWRCRLCGGNPTVNVDGLLLDPSPAALVPTCREGSYPLHHWKTWGFKILPWCPVDVFFFFFFFFFPVIGNGLRTSSGRIMNNSPRSEKQMSNYVVLMVFTQPDNAAAVILSNLQPSHPKGEKKVPLRSWQGLNH